MTHAIDERKRWLALILNSGYQLAFLLGATAAATASALAGAFVRTLNSRSHVAGHAGSRLETP
jgi:hypothetical protein